ncbi:Outer membrane receptor proteins, mostly Fe transport [Flavobacterium sp. CF108]|uniref:TonB-dependent receptor domain-containing protein n=1 Tax=unclassified Flavobacterium TaxID=196869 RepID=UPI0008CA1065|nr:MULTISPECIES: TonB-dependent receptor [unclassified Flavobacterium]SEO86064.1 Outer membrane receptor proteins, mostly Fe transport [Flavobacterium sp. fv08]SHG69233.1 Outer membrane receptor proteins, mostly Fe transport [Flavobacterium sp. CF108]
MKKANLLIFLLLPLFCLAQASFKLKGNITSETTSLEWADVSIINSEGKIIDGTTTKNDGYFEFNLKKGSYKIGINLLGFTDYEKEISIEKDTDLGIIILKESATNLVEVVIQSKNKTVEQKTDRLVYNIEKNVTTVGSDALSAINTAPGVVVKNDMITILGKGTSRVMIDGRMIELAGEELNNFLKSISASDIKNIEIISNPPAKYEAEGAGGLINIIMKKGMRDSWKNTTTVSYDQNKYGIYTLRDNFFYNKNKFRFSASVNGKTGYKNADESLEMYFPDGLSVMKSETKVKNENLSGKLALDYDFSERTTFGFQFLNDRNNPDFGSDIRIEKYNIQNQLDNVTLNDSYTDKGSGNQTYNVHLITKLDSLNRKLSFDVDYFNYNSKFDRSFIANNYTPDMTFVDVNQSGRNISNQDIDNWSFKADMEHPFQALNLSYGAKMSFTNSISDVFYYNTISGTPELDPNQSNRFKYTENNQAVYINGDKKMGEKWNFQMGLRLENTQTNGFSETMNQETVNNYLKLFPTVYASYKKNENNTFSLNYGKRINRPRFDLLNPFKVYINSNSYSEGNPFLRPSFSDNFEFAHSYKEILRTSVFVNVVTNGYGVLFTANPETNTQVVTRENYFKNLNYGIGESYSANFTKWWSSENSLYFLGAKTDFIKDFDATPSNSLQIDFSTNNTFILGKTTKLQVDFSYSSPFKSGLYEIGYTSSFDIGFKQDLFNKTMQIAFLANDIFNTSYLKDFTSVVNGVKQVYSQNESNRFVRLSVVYNFGNKKINVKERAFGNQDEKKRTGN